MSRAAAAAPAVARGARRARRATAVAATSTAAAARQAAGARAAAPARRPSARPPARRPSPAPGRGAARRSATPTRIQRVGIALRARAGRAVERVLYGPGLIAVVFLLLAGVVFANVALLQKNRQVTRDAARVSELKRENATLRAEVALLGSSERIQQVAAERGLVLPAPDQIRYLSSNPRVDAVAAAKQVDEGAAALAAAPTYADPAASGGYDSTASAGYVDPSTGVAADPSSGYPAPATEAGTPLAAATDPSATVP